MVVKFRQKTLLGIIIIALAFFVFGVAVGASLGKDRGGILAVYTQPEGVDFTPLWKAWKIIDERFVPIPKSATSTQTTTTTEQEKLWGTIKGLAESLGDPYTTFLPPEDNKMFLDDMSGSFEGVGMEITVKNGLITVVAPLKDTPAYKAGIKPGDVIVKIDGKSTEGMSLDTAVKLIRGPKGTPVTLTVYREGEKDYLDIKIIRDKINIPTLEHKDLGNGIYYINLMNFSANSPELFREALKEFYKKGYKKLIIDLRGNPGGYLDAAVDIASWFLPEDAVVVTEDYGGKKPQTLHYSNGYNTFGQGYDIVVLIDKGSASASEILAGALRAHKKAILIGENSFGKGSVQELIPITKDTSLKLTIARWILPDGSYINSSGIKPDIEVEDATKSKDQKQDPALKKAIEFLLTR